MPEVCINKPPVGLVLYIIAMRNTVEIIMALNILATNLKNTFKSFFYT